MRVAAYERTAMSLFSDAVTRSWMAIALRDAVPKTIKRNAENAKNSFAAGMLMGILLRTNAVVYLFASSVEKKKEKMSEKNRMWAL